MSRISSSILLTLCLWLIASSVQAQGSVDLQLMARLYVSSDTHGHVADPVCRDGEDFEPTELARSLSALSMARHADPQSLMIDTGTILGPHAVARFAAQTEPAQLAALLADLGYDAIGFGETELGLPRSMLLDVARALRSRGVPLLATNLYCGPEAQDLCDALVDGVDGVPFFQVGRERIALFAFLTPEALGRVPPENTRGVRLAPLKESMIAAVRAARARGATAVIVSVQDGSGADAVSRVMANLAGVSAEDKPDLVLSAEAGAELIFARPATFRPPIASAPTRGTASVEVRRDTQRGIFDVLVQPMTPADSVHDPLSSFLDRMGRAYCERWGRALPGARLGADSLDADGMLDLTAGILLEATGAEIALLGRGVTDSTYEQAGDTPLTASDVFVALQYDDPLATATVPGTWLRTLARSLDPAKLLALGLSVSGANTATEKIKVNGRALELQGNYRIVTSSFLATGGDRLLPAGADFTLSHDLRVRGAVLDYLGRPRPGDPRESLPDLADRVEWSSRFDTDATFTGSSVRNPGDYTDSQLARENTAALGLGSTLAFAASSRSLAWDNTLTARYSVTQTGNGFDEGDDLISYRTNLRYRGWHSQTPEVYVPEPFLEAFVESEFTTSDTLGYHHLLVRPTLGFAFTLTSKLLLKLNGGFEVEALDPEASVLPGAGANLELKPWQLMRDGVRRVDVGLTVDYFVSDIGAANRQTLRARFDTTFTLSGSLSFALLVDLFGVRSGAGPFSIAINTTAALRFRFVGRRLAGS
ncbi:MAG: hypothetical protein GXP55_00130 [Deltaproteobacteria bacterium]|nr:hypothetical protein [Deltaproteobacteria bacterium]